jgi:ubiquinone/menaquinone biosynthesis C-methylase UbiE
MGASEVRKHEKAVFDTYENLAGKILEKGYRHNPTYLARKAIVDWDLMISAGIQNKSILNVGCFEPIDEIVWAGFVKEWTAIDLSPSAINIAKTIIAHELPAHHARRVKLKVMNAQELKFPDASFDVAVSFSVIDHMPDRSVREKTITEMARVVKKGGFVVVTVPNRYSYYRLLHGRNVRRRIQTDVGYQYFYSYWELKKAVISAGLKPLRFTSDMKNVGDLPRILRALLLPFQLFGDRMGFLARKQ